MYPPVKLMARWAALLICLCALAPAHAQVPPIIGDVDDDGFVGIADINLVLGYWNQNVPPADPRADPSGDGFVGIEDLNYVLGNWNAGHPPLQPFKGMNLHQVKEWSREWPFVDVVKTVQRWIPTNPNGQPFELDEAKFLSGDPDHANYFAVASDPNGWPILQPGQAVHAVMFKGNGGFYPASTVENPHYVVTFDVTFDDPPPGAPPGGYSDVALAFDFDAGNTEAVVSDGRMTFKVATPTNNGVIMRIANNHPASPVTVHNVKVWMPGFENAESPFHPLFVKRLRPFSVIRFMDWQQTNNVDEVPWGERATKAYFSQATGKGVALEYMIELCNELGASPWFCMPHKADGAYINSFATMVRDGDPANNVPPLHDQADIYVEWSNEVWNNQFNVYKWLTQELGHPVNSQGPGEYFDTWADGAALTFKTWYDKYAEVNKEGRIVRVVAGQAANVWVTDNVTDRLKDRTDIAEQFDAVSCAAYFGKRVDKLDLVFNQNTTAQDVIDHATTVTIPESEGWYKQHGNIGDGVSVPKSGLAWELSDYLGRPIKFLAYEAGQHYTSQGISNLLYTQALYDAQDHMGENGGPGIYEAYIQNLTAFDEAGGSLFMAFNYVSKQEDLNGSWGQLEAQDQAIEDAHKFRAILNYMPQP